MDIKLKARLSAYSNIELSSDICDRVDTITNDQIDLLFDETSAPKRVSEDAIASLFD